MPEQAQGICTNSHTNVLSYEFTHTQIISHFLALSYLFDSLQHRSTTLPWLGAFADAREARHAVPLAVLQLPVKGVGE